MESRNLSIMMTDIKGFTNKTSGYSRDQIEELLKSHEQLLTPLFTKYNGTVIKTIGDAFLVTFESASEAINAGMDIQRALSANNARVSEDKKLLVRVAINAGEVNLREGDIFGEPVNITARVESIALAGHVTFTDTVRLQLNKDSVPYTELGEFNLKGIPHPVNLYQVTNDWAVDSEDEPPKDTKGSSGSEKDSASADDGSKQHQKPSGICILHYLIVAILVSIAVFVFNSRESDIDVARKLMAENNFAKASDLLAKILRKVPSNKEVAQMKRTCDTALLEEEIKQGNIIDALKKAVKLVGSASSADDRSWLTDFIIAKTSQVFSDAEKSQDYSLAAQCISVIGNTIGENPAITGFNIKLDMYTLETVYRQSLKEAEKGASAVQRLLRASSFDQIISRVRGKLQISGDTEKDKEFSALRKKYIPLLDYYGAYRMITAVGTVTPTAWIDGSVKSSRKADEAISMLASALENDATLRQRQELKESLVTLLKFFRPDGSEGSSNTAVRLRRTISAFIIDWMAPAMCKEAMKGPDVKDGALFEEAAYRLRHNTVLILKAAGKLKMLNMKTIVKFDFGWFRQYKRNDSTLRTRLKLCEHQVFDLKDAAVTTEFEAVIEELKKRLSLRWGEK